MKKKRQQGNNKIYRISAAPSPFTNEVRLKQIYNAAYKSRDKTPKSFSIHKNPDISQTQDKGQNNKNSRYRAYLQSELVPKLRHNRRYSRKVDKDTQQESVPALTSRTGRNDSVDMFKIRRSKVNSSHKVSPNSFTRLDDQNNDFETAKNLYKQGKFTQAAQIADKCLEKQQKNPQILYYNAIIRLNLHNYESGLELLDKICYSFPEYKKTSFMFAAISAKKLGKLQLAYQYCSSGIKKFPTYLDLVLYRANLSMIMSKYTQAHKDYQQILKQDQNNVQILLKNALCLHKSGAYANSLSNLTTALYHDTGAFKQQILTKKIQIYLQPKSYNLKQAKKDLNRLTSLIQQVPSSSTSTFSSTSPHSSIFFLKGLILSAEGSRKQSILAFESCLKDGTCKDTTCKALVEIVKSKIQDRDFYSAAYHINRSKYLGINSQDIEIYQLFSEGVVYLMKRKVIEGDNNFTAILKKYQKLPQFLNKIFYLYRAFAKFSLSDYSSAIQNYERSSKQCPLDIFAKYNKQLAQGTVQIQNKNYEAGFNYFNNAQKTISFSNLNKIDTYLYRGAAHIQRAKNLINSPNDIDQLQSLEQIFAGLKQLDKAYDINENNSNLLYYRSLVYMYLGKYDQALQDIIKAISKSQQNVAKYFYFRSIAHNSLNNTKQALNDLNICCNLDQKYWIVYLQRAKIHFSNQNITKALQDLNKLKQYKPNQDIKYHETCLNYYYGHYSMANACANQLPSNAQTNLIKILIKIKLGKIKQLRKLMTKSSDIMILDIIQQQNTQIVTSTNLQYYKLYHYHHYIGIKYFHQQQYKQSIDSFIMATKQRNLYNLQQGITNNNIQQQQNTNTNTNTETNVVTTQDHDYDAINRINYNIFVCYLMLKQWKKGYQVFIRDVIGVKDSYLKNQYIATFTHMLFQAIKENKYAVNKEDKAIYQLYLYESKLDCVVGEFQIQLPNFIMKTRLCLLGISDRKLEQRYSLKANPQFILGSLRLGEIQNKPEPPWVKREQSGLIFTDQVQNINIEFQTTENDEEQDQDQEDEDDEDEDEEGDEEGDQQNNDDDDDGDRDDGDGDGDQIASNQKQFAGKVQRISMRKFKEKMKLGDSIERKLNKIMEKGKNKQ